MSQPVGARCRVPLGLALVPSVRAVVCRGDPRRSRPCELSRAVGTRADPVRVHCRVPLELALVPPCELSRAVGTGLVPPCELSRADATRARS
jgi:hypothetical protein